MSSRCTQFAISKVSTLVQPSDIHSNDDRKSFKLLTSRYTKAGMEVRSAVKDKVVIFVQFAILRRVEALAGSRTVETPHRCTRFRG